MGLIFLLETQNFHTLAHGLSFNHVIKEPWHRQKDKQKEKEKGGQTNRHIRGDIYVGTDITDSQKEGMEKKQEILKKKQYDIIKEKCLDKEICENCEQLSMYKPEYNKKVKKMT